MNGKAEDLCILILECYVSWHKMIVWIAGFFLWYSKLLFWFVGQGFAAAVVKTLNRNSCFFRWRQYLDSPPFSSDGLLSWVILSFPMAKISLLFLELEEFLLQQIVIFVIRFDDYMQLKQNTWSSPLGYTVIKICTIPHQLEIFFYIFLSMFFLV